MSQIESGIKNLLSHAFIYNLFQWGVGATSARKQTIQKFAKPQSGMTVLDIGCGPGSIIKYLPPAVKYYGIDNNPKYINFARNKFENHNFICEDINKFSFSDNFPKFDLIVALGILHHLDDDESLKLLNFSANLANKTGRLITLDGCYTDNQSRIAKYMLQQDRGQNIRTETEYRTLAEKKFKNVKTTILHDMLRIPYTLLVMECSL